MQGKTLCFFFYLSITRYLQLVFDSILRAQNGEMKIDYLFLKILRCSVLLLHDPRAIFGEFMRGLQNV